MSAVAQLLVEFIALDPARSTEFILWAMSRGHIGLEAKTAALLLKCEILKQSAAEDNFTAEALSQAAELLGGDE